MAHDMTTGAGAGQPPVYPEEVAPATAYQDTTYQETGENVADHSVGELLARVTGDLSTLMRQEVELAKAEAKEEARKAGKAGGMLGAAGFAGYMVALFLTVAIMAALAIVMPWALAALIVTVLWGIVGFVLYKRGRAEMTRVQGLPRTTESLKEDAEWARHPTS